MKRRLPTSRGRRGCTRGASVIEYILLIGAVCMVALGMYRIFGDMLKTKIQGQSAAVQGVDGPAGEQPGSNGAVAKSVQGDDGAGEGKVAQPASGKGDDHEKSVSAVDGANVGVKARTDGVPEGRVQDGRAAAPTRRGLPVNVGWIIALVGIIVFAAVLFKGKRMAKQDSAPS